MKFAGCLDEFRHGGQQRHTASGGLVKALQSFKRDKRIAGLAGSQRSGFMALVDIAQLLFRSGLCLGVGAEGHHPAFAIHGERDTIKREIFCRAIDFRPLILEFNCDREGHLFAGTKRRFLCKICANSRNSLKIPNNSGAHSRT